jgi:hypothetical protein
MDAVRCYIHKAQNHWDEHLAQIAGALRSAVNRHTGYTANRLMLGREVNTPADLMFGDVRKDPPVDIEAYVLDLERATQMAHETASSRLKTSEERMKRDYDLKEFTRSYNLGDLVYVLDTATVKGKCRKLSPSWKGPGIILKKLSPRLYRVKTKSSVMVVNHDRLKHCRDRDIPLWLSRYQEKFRSTPAETHPALRGRDFPLIVLRRAWGLLLAHP